jgi:hypothetical protein
MEKIAKARQPKICSEIKVLKLDALTGRNLIE